MTPQQISLVQTSFAKIFPIKGKFAADFYGLVFDMAPQVRSMFPEDMSDQRAKVTDTLVYIVKNLQAPEVMLDSVRALARRHVGYGVQPGHYAVVGEALVEAIHVNTPGGLSEAEVAAWQAAYAVLSETICQEIDKAA